MHPLHCVHGADGSTPHKARVYISVALTTDARPQNLLETIKALFGLAIYWCILVLLQLCYQSFVKAVCKPVQNSDYSS